MGCRREVARARRRHPVEPGSPRCETRETPTVSRMGSQRGGARGTMGLLRANDGWDSRSTRFAARRAAVFGRQQWCPSGKFGFFIGNDTSDPARRDRHLQTARLCPVPPRRSAGPELIIVDETQATTTFADCAGHSCACVPSGERVRVSLFSVRSASSAPRRVGAVTGSPRATRVSA